MQEKRLRRNMAPTQLGMAGGLMLWVLLAAAAQAATWHVAPDGTGQGDGSREKPFSVAHALKVVDLMPGDQVVFLDGVYKGGVAVSSIGNEKAPITYRAENRHKAILDGGTPLRGWRKVADQEGVWENRIGAVPERLLCNGEGLVSSAWPWRRDGKQSLDEGMFACEKLEADPAALDERQGGFAIRIRPWAGEEPKEVFALAGTLVQVGGAYNIVDGFLLRRSVIGVGLGGKQVHTYKQEAGAYLDVSGLVHNSYGSFNVVRNCIIRDMMGCGMTSNESRFNLIEDCVIYNSGMGQGDHGIYISQGAENLVLRRNVWWRTSGGAIHIYSGSGIDSPRGIVVERNIFGPDKRNRCFPLANRKSAALYVWGGSRWAGANRIVHNIVIGPVDRAMSVHRCHFNLIANNTLLGSDGAPIQIGSSFGNLILNNILEHSPGDDAHPTGYIRFLDDARGPALNTVRNNLLLNLPKVTSLREVTEVPAWAQACKLATADPFRDRAKLDFRPKPASDAIGLGIPFPHLTPEGQANAPAAVPGAGGPAAGALEPTDEPYGPKGRFPEIPPWLLAEWPLTSRGR